MSISWNVRQCIYCNLDPNSTPTQKSRKHTYLTKHMDNSHPECGPIEGVVLCCPQCDRHFVRGDTLEEHIRRIHKGPNNPLISLANVAEEERREQERREEERRDEENERRVHDQARRARTIHQYRKNINKSPYTRRQDRKGLIPYTIAEESGDYEFKAKRSVKRSRKAKR